MRSGLLTTLFLVAGLAITVFVYREHRKGNLHKFTTPSTPVQPQGAIQPGGKDSFNLSRLEIQNGTAPEFLSTLVFPGLGMDVWQISAAIPMRPHTDLLASPAPEEQIDKLGPPDNDDSNDESSARYLSKFGAPLVAWTSRNNLDEEDLATNALVLQQVEGAANHAMPDGGDVTAVFQSAKPGPGKLPAGLEMRASYLLSGRAVDLELTARNNGTAVAPLRLGWMPHFAIPKGQRQAVKLYIPSTQQLINGKTVESKGTALDFSHTEGRSLGERSLDLTFVKLTHDFLSTGTKIDVQMPGYVLRLSALTSNIRSVRIIAPADANWIAVVPIADSTDTLADRVAQVTGETPRRGLAAGDTMQYKLRLEVLPAAAFSRTD